MKKEKLKAGTTSLMALDPATCLAVSYTVGGDRHIGPQHGRNSQSR